jgi:hypothetical protein
VTCFVLPVDRYRSALFATFQMKLDDTVLVFHRETAIFSGKRSCQSRDLKRRRTATWSDGKKYVGEYKDDKKHGQGTHTFPNGEKYVGEYKDNKHHGQGTYTWPDGTAWKGYFMNDEYVPHICSDMGLTKGSPEHGQCVLKLMDSVMSEED